MQVLIWRLIAVVFVLVGVTQLVAGEWLAATATWTASLAYLVTSMYVRRQEVLSGAVDGLLATIGGGGDEKGFTTAVVRTREPERYVLMDEACGSRWRMGEHGTWTKESW